MASDGIVERSIARMESPLRQPLPGPDSNMNLLFMRVEASALYCADSQEGYTLKGGGRFGYFLRASGGTKRVHSVQERVLSLRQL